MPNFRIVDLSTQGLEFRISAKPVDWRRKRFLGWMPYLTGSEVSVHVKAERIGEPPLGEIPVNTVCMVYFNGLRTSNQMIWFDDGFSLPYEFETPTEYISAPGEFVFDIHFLGEEMAVVDFSVMSKDRIVFGIILASFAVIGSTVGSLLVNILV